MSNYLKFSIPIVIGLGIFLLVKNKTTIAIPIQKIAAIEDLKPTHANDDIEPQQPIANPPSIIKAAYVTSWSAGNEKKISSLIQLAKTTEINALVVDIKDYTGVVSYETEIPELKKYAAQEARIPKINTFVKRLHDAGIYIIGRIAVFEDQKLALARPSLALQSQSTHELWHDHKGLHWMDTASQEVWDYNVAVAKNVIAHGFDEVNFDYIRFPSDGNMDDIDYPVWDGINEKSVTVKEFFAYLRAALPDAKLSADLFGMVATNADDLGIGQHLEDALPYFDAVAPMVYPSHYASGFLGFENPANFPYEIVWYSADQALGKIENYERARTKALISGDKERLREYPQVRAKLRPWLQDFNLGATYNATKVLAQINALYDATESCTPEKNINVLRERTKAMVKSMLTKSIVQCTENTERDITGTAMGGWMLWNPSNTYTKGALQNELN